MINLANEIAELIEAHGQVGSADFNRLRTTYSASPIEIASEIDRVLKADSRLAAKHELAREISVRARSSRDDSTAWLEGYTDRASALGWTRDDLLGIAAGERSPAGSMAAPVQESPSPGPSAPATGRRSSTRPADDRAQASPPDPESAGRDGVQDLESGGAGDLPESVRDRGGVSESSSDDIFEGRLEDNSDPSLEGSSEGDGSTGRAAETHDDDFPVRQVTAFAILLVLVTVMVAAVIIGNSSGRVNPAEQSAWQRAEESGSSQSYRTFIEQWPNSDRIEVARERLASLAERQAAALERAALDQQARIREAQRYLSILGYDLPSSGELDAATLEAVAAFENRRDLPNRGNVDAGLLRELESAWRAADDEIWRKARAQDTAEAVMRYLRAYPEGANVAAARARLEVLQDDAERRAFIESIQRELVRLGRDVEVSGVMDAPTRAEIRDYRAANWQSEDAPLDASLLAGLRDLQRWPPQPGESFVDCPQCPAMVVIPGGEFVMGSPPDQLLRATNEGPQRRVTVPRFALARTEVTFNQYLQCVEAGACSYIPHDEGWGRQQRPVINVSMEDAGAYVRWLSEITGRRYRLPSEAEWEYAARAGTTTRFHTGVCLNSLQANFDARLPSGNCPAGAQLGQTIPVASFPPNPFGLFDMLGNAQEWTLDCWNPSYQGAPSDGSAWLEGDCSRAVLRGGSWRNSEGKLRSASRTRPSGSFHNDHTGFRPALSLKP